MMPHSQRPSLLPPDHLLQVQLALRSHDGQPVLQVVADQVTDAIEQDVLRTHLWRG